MDEYYERLAENLGKLQRNESQMTEEQKKQYAAPLKKLKDQIREDAVEVANTFPVSGIRLKEVDSKDCKNMVKQVQKIFEEHSNKGTFKKAGKKLFETFSILEFLNALCVLRTDIWYQAYGPYWIKHCTMQDDPEYPFHNDIIDMDWWAEHNEWAKTKIENGKRVTDYFGGVTVMMPPTKEQLDKEYSQELERIK